MQVYSEKKGGGRYAGSMGKRKKYLCGKAQAYAGTGPEKIFTSKLAPYVRELYLYGSVARGRGTWESDIDLFLVLDEPEGGRKELKKEILNLREAFRGMKWMTRRWI